MTSDLPLQYAEAGLRVHPLHWPRINGRCSCGRRCPTPAKHPLLPRGQDDASSDVAQVEEWIRRWPLANWGACPPERVVVVDEDPRHDGHLTWAELQREHGPAPETLEARTGGGGWHRWYLYTGPVKGKLGQGLDLKTSRGYVICPPSRHISGGKYSWVDPDRVAVPAPAWFRTILSPPPRRPVARPIRRGGQLDGLVKFVGESLEGERNRRLHWACCRAVEQGADPTPLVEAAVEIGSPRVEAERTAASARRAYEREGARRR